MMQRKYFPFKVILLILFILANMNFLKAQPPVNPNATKETKTLKAYLDSIYGKKILSGQVDDKYLQYIKDATNGKSPAIMGYDFNGICPSQGGNVDADKAIDWVKNKKGIAQFQWHWISPNADGDFYTTKFKLDAALQDTNSTSYKNIIRDIDLVAQAMKKMQNAGVPILWRPLHEAEGKWFWWGMSGGDACRKLWKLMYDRLTNYHKLNNLLWVWNSYGQIKENWYPGDSLVDIIAWDYPDYSAPNGSWGQYQKMFGSSGKLFGIGEDGRLTDPNVLSSQPWLYFLTWAYMIQDKNTKDWIFKVYNDPRVITLDDLQPGTKAYAGISKTVFDADGDGFETVTLDGSESRTDSGTIVSYIWTEGEVKIAEGVSPVVSLGLGNHNIKLTVTTSTSQSKSAYVSILVRRMSLTYNKKAYALSTESGSGNIASNAVDGNDATRWASINTDLQWFAVDMGEQFDVKQVVLKWEAASGKNYRIEVSNNAVSWMTVASKSDMPSGTRNDTLSNLSGTGRYIRMYATARTSTFGYSLWEFEVYGNKSSTSMNESEKAVPSVSTLGQNYPNPFNPATKIDYSVSKSGNVRLSVYNILGQLKGILVNEFKTPGTYSAEFYADNLSSGIYYYLLESDGYRSARKMQLLK